MIEPMVLSPRVSVAAIAASDCGGSNAALQDNAGLNGGNARYPRFDRPIQIMLLPIRNSGGR
jgi:hypothetical protein